jgi:predicted ferric reductase
LAERIAREVRGRHKTYVSKVIQHPSNVCEIQIKKDKTITRAGQVRNIRLSSTCGDANKAPSTSSCAAQRSPCGNTIRSL